MYVRHNLFKPQSKTSLLLIRACIKIQSFKAQVYMFGSFVLYPPSPLPPDICRPSRPSCTDKTVEEYPLTPLSPDVTEAEPLRMDLTLF